VHGSYIENMEILSDHNCVVQKRKRMEFNLVSFHLPGWLTKREKRIPNDHLKDSMLNTWKLHI